MNNRRVLFVHDGPLFVDEKQQYYSVHVSNALVQRYLNLGVKVTILIRVVKASENELQGLTKITSHKVEIASIPDFKSFSKYIEKITEVKKIINNAINHNDIIVVRLPSAAGVIAAKSAQNLNKPLMVEMVGCTFDGYWNYNWKGKLIAHYKYYSLKKLIQNVNYIVYVTERFLQKRYPSKAASISCSNVYLNNINESALRERIKKIESRDESNAIILGTVASMNVSYKGQHYVMHALASLKNKGLKFNYYLVGQGDDTFLRNLVIKLGLQNEIKFIGPLKHENILDFLNEIDIYIQPSQQEGLPRAVIEAMSTACPALGSDVAGIPELLNEDSIFKAGNVLAIEQILQNVNKEWMLKSAQENFSKAHNYQFEILNKRRIDFYQKFLLESGLK